MTRQSRARWLAFATALLVVLLAALFAWLRNLPPAPQAGAVAAPKASVSRDEPGRAAFVRAGCSGCHSADGRGNPAHPLDGIGTRLDREALRDAAFALGGAAKRFPPAVAQRKRAHANDADADALLAYLQQLK
jgi:cbb3-type cytochrome oxidase cytochrome c subunit